ncbi:MAG: type II secretion system protein M [Spirochaetes bacterium]|nr:type II secretion system protein M [Spirochaetota bacterium]
MITLTQREKLLLKILVVCLAGLIVYYLIALPIIGLSGSAEDGVEKNIDDLNKLENIYKQYREIQQKNEKYSSMLSKKNENTTSMIEQWANSTGISKNIAYTRGSQSSIQNKYTRITTDIRIEGVAIQNFLKFLYEIENSDNLLKVNYLKITPALKGTNTYDINLKIDNYISK